MSYRISNPNQYLVRTGAFIEDLKLSKKGWVLPGQRFSFFDITPANYTLNLQAMSAEKLEFNLPAVFTIGPKDEPSSLTRYARLLSSKDKKSDHVQDIVRGIIEGETRVIAAGMTMEEIFQARKGFKDQVIKNVQAELEQFGLFIYNANVKQLQDTQGSEYFAYMRMKTHEGAVNQAKVDVAEAKYRGDVGAKEREGLTRRENAKIETETVVLENERKADVAKAEMNYATQKSEFERKTKIAAIEASQAAVMREAELQKEVEERRMLSETERQRVTLVAKATAELEASKAKAEAQLFTAQKVAEAELYQKTKENEAIKVKADAKLVDAQKIADGNLYKSNKEYEAALSGYDTWKVEADAKLYKIQKEAEAKLFSKQKEAEGLLEIYNAQAKGLESIVKAFGGNTAAALQYVMIDRGIYTELARENASAIRGLSPKITVWNTGAEGSSSNPIANIFQSLPPLLSTIQDQTGINPPSWLAEMPQTKGTAPNPKTVLKS
ncbi:hypothetical protein G9A89_023779 [Geosiphon pyriformis]|nr:hypothetical protein G9A89_023779 [Geosiphon pyriformis]